MFSLDVFMQLVGVQPLQPGVGVPQLRLRGNRGCQRLRCVLTLPIGAECAVLCDFFDFFLLLALHSCCIKFMFAL